LNNYISNYQIKNLKGGYKMSRLKDGDKVHIEVIDGVPHLIKENESIFDVFGIGRKEDLGALSDKNDFTNTVHGLTGQNVAQTTTHLCGPNYEIEKKDHSLFDSTPLDREIYTIKSTEGDDGVLIQEEYPNIYGERPFDYKSTDKANENKKSDSPSHHTEDYEYYGETSARRAPPPRTSHQLVNGETIGYTLYVIASTLFYVVMGKHIINPDTWPLWLMILAAIVALPGAIVGTIILLILALIFEILKIL
jgi:hypothetical protein